MLPNFEIAGNGYPKIKDMPTIAIVYHSTYGHTKLLAEAVRRGAQSFPGATAPIYTAEEATADLDKLDAADAIQVMVATRRYSVEFVTVQWIMSCEASPHSSFLH